MLPALAGLLSLRPASAAQPGDGRPYLELPWPGGRSYSVTCGYHCYQHKGNMSYGVDLDIPVGAPITAAAAGEVMAITWEIGLPRDLNLGDALIVYVDHGRGWFTRYIHLSALTVRVGDRVEMGQIIGYSGDTGASGAHLHFELRNGRSLSSPSVPIDELFGGKPPVAGQSYRSNNAPLPTEALPVVPTAVNPNARPAATAPSAPAAPAANGAAVRPGAAPPSPAPGGAPAPAAPAAAPRAIEVLPAAPMVDPSYASRVPTISEPLALSAGALQAGEPITVSFTVRNPTPEIVVLAAVGVRPVGDDVPGDVARGLSFTRSVLLKPGESYRFTQTLVVSEPGPLTLAPFALGVGDEWVPLAGDTAPRRVQLAPAPLYFPLLFGVPASSSYIPSGPTLRSVDK